MTSTDCGGRAAVARAAVALAMLMGAGCGPSDEYERVAVEGTVTLDGTPLGAGTISFVPQQQGAAARAEVAEGRFRLERSEGLSPGPYRVEIYSVQKTGRTVPSAEDPDVMVQEETNVLPARYNIRSQLAADIAQGEAEQPLEFALTTGGDAN